MLGTLWGASAPPSRRSLGGEGRIEHPCTQIAAGARAQHHPFPSQAPGRRRRSTPLGRSRGAKPNPRTPRSRSTISWAAWPSRCRGAARGTGGAAPGRPPPCRTQSPAINRPCFLAGGGGVLQALGPSSLDPGRLPLPLHHGDAVAELRQLGDGPRAARQDPGTGRAVLSQRGGPFGVPTTPCVPLPSYIWVLRRGHPSPHQCGRAVCCVPTPGTGGVPCPAPGLHGSLCLSCSL